MNFDLFDKISSKYKNYKLEKIRERGIIRELFIDL